MNKKDIYLILFIFLISFLCIFLLKTNQKKGSIANVYYENQLVLSIDLQDKTTRTYEVEGYNGTVLILTANGKVKVVEEKSPKHLCSKQGFIEHFYETIICLPNKIVIKIENNELDGVVY